MMTEEEKTERLEQAVISETPEEVRRVYKELGKVGFTAHALGIACLYRGVDMVKTLVECGANFCYSEEDKALNVDRMYSHHRYTGNKEPEYDFSLLLIEGYIIQKRPAKLVEGRKKLPVSERAKVLDYLCNNAEKTGIFPQRLLYFSIRVGNEEFYRILKRHGVSISEDASWLFKSASNSALYMDPQEFLKVFGLIAKEVGGEKIRGTVTFYQSYLPNVLSPESFRFILEHFAKTNMNQTKIMKTLIDCEEVSCLAIAEEYGWLKLPRKRDEMIQYASDKEKTESLAWLLNFKNRTADIKAEQKKAEKEAERALNADPNSIGELKKIWKFEKREDNTIIITGYKGNRSEIVVPQKIGEDIVTAIGDHAFSSDAKGIREEQRKVRKNITKVTLPDSVEYVGDFAFFMCKLLTEINIPEKLTEISKGMLDITGIKEIVIGGNVRKINPVALYGCRDLKSVKLCEGVREIDSGAFYLCTALERIELPRSISRIADCTMTEYPFHGCHKLTAYVYKGSYAEKYCENAKIKYEYIDEN